MTRIAKPRPRPPPRLGRPWRHAQFARASLGASSASGIAPPIGGARRSGRSCASGGTAGQQRYPDRRPYRHRHGARPGFGRRGPARCLSGHARRRCGLRSSTASVEAVGEHKHGHLEPYHRFARLPARTPRVSERIGCDAYQVALLPHWPCDRHRWPPSVKLKHDSRAKLENCGSR